MYKKLQIQNGNESRFWHQECRLQGFARAKHDWILFVDADEVLRDVNAFCTWFTSVRTKPQRSYKLANYWYFMSEKRRSKIVEDSIVLVHRTFLCLPQFRSNGGGEREHFYNPIPQHLKLRNVVGLEGQVMFDHFSWVRSKQAMLRKVETWGHRGDRSDWKELVEKAFREDPLTTYDFVHRDDREYEIV